MMQGAFYTHPAFLDVCFLLQKAFRVSGQDRWKLKVEWYHARRGWQLGSDKFEVDTAKLNEFKRR